MAHTIKSFLILSVLGFICQNFGPVSFRLESLIILTILITYIFISNPIKDFFIRNDIDDQNNFDKDNPKKTSNQNTKLLLIIRLILPYLFFIAFAIFISRLSNDLLQLAFLSIFLFCLFLFSKSTGKDGNEHAIPALTTIFFTLIIFFYQYFPQCWYLVELYSRLFSCICSFIYARVLNLGPTSFGFFIIVSFLIYHTIIFVLNKDRNVIRFCLVLVSFLFAGIIIVGVNLLTMYFTKRTIPTLYRNHLHTQFFLFLILCPSVLIYKKIEIKKVSIAFSKTAYKFIAPGFFIFLICVIFIFIPFFQSTSSKTKTIVFYKKGSLDWQTPRFGTYGQRSGGMFGIMPKHMNDMGFNSKMIDNITVSNLEQTAVLVMINLDKGLSREELLIIWDFVRDGGGLLLLGDHTNLAGLMVNFNQILEVVNIKFNFDSAMPTLYTWDSLMSPRIHPVVNSFETEIARSWWVGASLECKPPAVPIVSGKYCYSDWGYKHNAKNAFLGNRQFDYYEPLGDQVLAAYSNYGKGKIMAVGDTSSFHNTTFMDTHKFVYNVFDFLSDSSQGIGIVLNSILLGFMVASTIICAIYTFKIKPNMVFPLSFIILLCVAAIFSFNIRNSRAERLFPYDKLDLAYIDYSHKGRFDLMSWEDDSIGGLRNNLQRNGYFPLLLRDFDSEKLLKSKLLIIIAPTEPFSSNEIKTIKGFIENGGKVLITVGWEESDASFKLLESFGLKIDSVPLGWCSFDYKKISIQFHEAWPVVFDDTDNVEVICEPLGYPAVVQKKYGKGSVIVIADSYFLLNENLEGSEKFSTPNMFLLRDMLIR